MVTDAIQPETIPSLCPDAFSTGKPDATFPENALG
jgi:hypothetical protein